MEDVLPELPGPQRRAFEVALLIAPAREQPDPRGVAAAFLSALRALAHDRQVLVAIDDLQWLDSSSLQVIGFAARRLGPEPVGFLFTRRLDERGSPAPELERVLTSEHLTRIALGPLDTTALHHLIEADLGNAVPRPLLRRIHEVSGGNPFFALEQARALRAAGLHLGTGAGLPVPPTLRSLVQDRLARVFGVEREVLLAVAALASPTRELLVSLVGALDNGWPPLIDALESNIVEIVDGQVRFTHPLLRSVLYADTPLPVRQDLHRRLAALVADPEESARHLALAVDGPSTRSRRGSRPPPGSPEGGVRRAAPVSCSSCRSSSRRRMTARPWAGVTSRPGVVGELQATRPGRLRFWNRPWRSRRPVASVRTR